MTSTSLVNSPLLFAPEIHGHRGCRGLRPENTLPAFLHALALGVDVLELDVVIAHDHQVVVSHEPWLSARLGRGPQGQRLTPAQEQQYNLYQMPYATIRQCVVGEWAHPDFPQQRPAPGYRPLLREVLQQVEAASRQLGRPAVGFSVELKSSPLGDGSWHPLPEVFVELVGAELAAAQVEARTTLLSFDPRILQAARQVHAPVALCLLVEDYLPPAPRLFDALGFVPATLGPDFRLLSATLVRELRLLYPGLRLVPWTVNTPADLQLVRGWQVDGITTDYPDRLIAQLNRL